MKKNRFILLFFLFFGWSVLNLAYACTDSLPSFNKNNKFQYKYNFSVGYGIGNIWVSFLKKNYNSAEYQISAIGPLDATAEFQLNKYFSAGLSVAYSTINGSVKRFLVDEQLTIFTAYLRANYHFVHREKLDAYAGLGGGYVRSVYQNSLGVPSDNVPGTFGYTAQIGVKYYFINHAGLFAELGYVNGSFCLVGFTTRF